MILPILEKHIPHPIYIQWHFENHKYKLLQLSKCFGRPLQLLLKLEKVDAGSENRKVMGATDPAKADEGTIRKKYGLSIDKNSVHGSDSIENATKEINFFFKI